jgi:hypothetical protein
MGFLTIIAESSEQFDGQVMGAEDGVGGEFLDKAGEFEARFPGGRRRLGDGRLQP